MILEQLKSYLSNRKQRVDLEFIKTNCYASGVETVKCGVPQGYFLGPKLFNMYINDFPNIINTLSHTLLFTDDSSILVTSTNYIELNQKLTSILHHISKWFQTKKLVLNPNQTYVVKITSSKAVICPLNTIHVDQTLPVAETIKFLGSYLDSHLSWKCHINMLLKKQKLCMFYDEKTVLLTKHRYIKNSLLCTLSITDKLWYNFLGLINNNAQYIFNTKIIIRVMLGLGPGSSCRGEFKKLNTLAIQSLYFFFLLVMLVRNPYHFENNSSIPL